jgi:uncharacterized protein YecE (DUF72 family)
MYYSAYPPEYLAMTARQIRETAVPGRESWCIFDNTALGEAMTNALGLLHRLARAG